MMGELCPLVECTANTVTQTPCLVCPHRQRIDRAELRRLAEEAKLGARGDAGAGRWDAYYTTHGDPYVVEEGGRGLFGHVATVGTSPEDYGRARALYLAAVCPAAVLELLDELDRLAAKIPDQSLDAQR